MALASNNNILLANIHKYLSSRTSLLYSRLLLKGFVSSLVEMLLLKKLSSKGAIKFA